MRKARKPSFERLESRRLLAASAWAFADAMTGRLAYGTTAVGDRIPDFSMVGYKTGSVPLPNTPGGVSVPVKATVNPGAAGVDMTSAIQMAINNVSGMSLDANGFRGAVLLTAGNYPISGTLTINASGVVLMGVGDSATTGTRLEATGTATRFLIEVDGSGSRSTSGTTYNVTDSYVPVGANSFHVDSTSGLLAGDSILVTRPSPADWIHDIGMDLLDNPWVAGSKNQNWERTVASVDTVNKLLTLDVPLTNSLDQNYDGGTLKHYTYTGRINQVGISDLYMYSDSLGAGDLMHATGSIDMDRTSNGWIHNITSDGFAVNQVVLSGGAKYCTVDDALIQNTTVSSQAPPAGLSINGQLNLASNIIEHGVYHAVALGATIPGPNVITNLFADGIGSDCGPHQRWSTGGLFDLTTIVGNDLQANNRGNSGTGHGWAGANYVFWNCSARNLEISSPPTAQNWAIGSSGTKSGDGIFESQGTAVTPNSLYQKQLWDRLHQNPTVVTAANATPNPRSGSTTALSVLGGYNLGESNLTYTWSVTSKPSGAADPTFSANGTNAAKNTTATFSAAGTYVFAVSISDAGGLKAISSVIVTDRPTTVINGDQDFANENDSIRIVRNGSFVDVFRNGALALHQDYATSPELVINALGGTDTITVDYSGGNPSPANGLFIDGGTAADVVSVTGSAGAETLSLSVGSVSVNGGQFGYTGGEAMQINLGAGSDSLTAGGNSSIGTSALLLTIPSGGTVTVPGSAVLPNFTDVTVNAGGTFSVNGSSQTIDALSGAGNVNATPGAAATLTVGQNSSSSSFSGSISGALSLVKVGGGTLVLSGNNSYTGTTTISGGVIESGNSASLAGLSGAVLFNGGAFHVTANTTSANVSNKYSTSFTGASSASTGTFDIDAGVTLTIGTVGGSAGLRTNGGGAHGGRFSKTGPGTLRLLTANGQQDDPFQLNQGTLIAEHNDSLGRGDAGVQVDVKSGATLVLKVDSSGNFLTPINAAESGSTINVVIDRLTPGAAVTHSVNAITSAGAFTLNLTAGSNITSGVAALSTASLSPAAGSAFTKSGNATLVLTNSFVTTGTTTITAGTMRLAGGGTRLIKTTGLSITGAGVLDLADNDLIVDYATTSPIGSWNGSAYTGIAGLIATGHIISPTTGPNGAVTMLALDEASHVLGLSGTATTLWNGQTADATSVLIKYTYAGDADMDGDIDADDFAVIDFNSGSTTRGYNNGDFNFDGAINADDYALIDFNNAAQGPPL